MMSQGLKRAIAVRGTVAQLLLGSRVVAVPMVNQSTQAFSVYNVENVSLLSYLGLIADIHI